MRGATYTVTNAQWCLQIYNIFPWIDVIPRKRARRDSACSVRHNLM